MGSGVVDARDVVPPASYRPDTGVGKYRTTGAVRPVERHREGEGIRVAPLLKKKGALKAGVFAHEGLKTADRIEPDSSRHGEAPGRVSDVGGDSGVAARCSGQSEGKWTHKTRSPAGLALKGGVVAIARRVVCHGAGTLVEGQVGSRRDRLGAERHHTGHQHREGERQARGLAQARPERAAWEEEMG